MNPLVASAVARVQAPLLRLGLHQRIAVFVSSILLAVFVAFGYLGWSAISSSEHSTLAERQATARVVARHLDTFVDHATAHLVVIADDLASGANNGELESHNSLRRIDAALHHVSMFFRRLLVVDTDGLVIASDPPTTTEAVSAQTRDWIVSAARSRKPLVSGLVPLPSDGARGVVFVAPISVNRRVAGVLVGELQLPHPSVYAVASALELGETGHMEVIDATATVLASTSPDDIFEKSEHASFYTPLLATHTTTVGPALYEDRDGDMDEHDEHSSPAGGIWHTMAFVPLENAGWGVGLGQTEAETFAAGRDLRNRALGVAAAALALALCFAWIGTRSVVSPIRELTGAGERMAAGDLSVAIGVEQSDEIGRLGRVMEVMRQRLGGSLAEIRAWNTELEQRVRDRTRELETSNRHLQVLTRVATATGRGPAGREAVLQRALEELVPSLGAESGWGSLWDPQHRQLRLVASYWMPNELRDAERVVDSGDATCLSCLSSANAVFAEMRNCPVLPLGLNPRVAHGRCWSAAIRLGEEVLGRLVVATAPGRVLNQEELDLLEAVARQVAVAFDSARLVEETARLEAARRMDLLRAEFLGSVSHELRTPLGFVKGYATTLLRDDVAWSNDQQHEFLHIIDEECDHLTGLVEDLLDAARVQTGRLRLTIGPVDVPLTIRRSVERMAASLANREVRLSLADVPIIRADASRIEQVILNLLQNACRYSPPGAPLEIQLVPENDGLRIGVLDRGVGLSTVDAERIFEPFYRTESAASAHAGGAGLGLAICRSIVESHGGRMWAEARPDGGTAMFISLPREACVIDEGEVHTHEATTAGR